MTSSESSEATRLRDNGLALLESARFAEAEAALTRSVALAPADPLAHFRLALVFVDTGRPAAAVAALDRSLALDPGNARAHNNRGSALQMQGRVAEAEHAFRRALELAPDLEQPYLNLGHLLEKRGQTAEAARLYEAAIARGLDPASFGHHLAAALGRPSDRAPERWVRATFDNFAPTFDQRLHALGYDAPARLAAMLLPRLPGPADILDLGCGTGLCGVALASRKRRLVGVDLSEKMLALARARQIYDVLDAGDVEAWLDGAATGDADVVVATDVFIYIGALERVFAQVARVLRPNGWFAFTTEDCATGDFALQATGRFGQSHAYIARLAAASFATAVAEPAVIRIESGTPVRGHLYLLQRTME